MADIDRIMQLLIPVNGAYAQYLGNDICPICYAYSQKMSSHSPNHDRGGLWQEVGNKEQKWGALRKRNMWNGRFSFAGRMAFKQHNAVITLWPLMWEVRAGRCSSVLFTNKVVRFLRDWNSCCGEDNLQGRLNKNKAWNQR